MPDQNAAAPGCPHFDVISYLDDEQTHCIWECGEEDCGQRFVPARDGWVLVNAETLAGALTCLVGQHRSVVSEFSGNFGGHVAIRDGWVDWDEDTVTEECPVCEVIAALRGDTDA